MFCKDIYEILKRKEPLGQILTLCIAGLTFVTIALCAMFATMFLFMFGYIDANMYHDMGQFFLYTAIAFLLGAGVLFLIYVIRQ